MKYLLAFTIIAVLVSLPRCAGLPIQVDGPPIPAPTPQRMIGFTIDDVSRLPEIVGMLNKIDHKPFVRIVFDEGVPASNYKAAVQAIHPYAFIMGELLDSEAVSECSQSCYEKRAREYFAALPLVDVWETCNEINGGSDDNWLGDGADRKCLAALDIARAAGKKTAVTLYLQPDQAMFSWAVRSLPEASRSRVDYALVSYYAKDNGDWKPDWQSIADRLGALFPAASIGVGECGDDRSQDGARTEFNRYYRDLTVDHPRWIGFGGWWYQKQLIGKNAFLQAEIGKVMK